MQQSKTGRSFCGKGNYRLREFLQLIKIWQGAKITDEIINKISQLKIPLKRKTIPGKAESEIALKIDFLLKRKIQIRQYAKIKTEFTTKYIANASSLAKPKLQNGRLNIIKAKQPYLPICSKISTTLF